MDIRPRATHQVMQRRCDRSLGHSRLFDYCPLQNAVFGHLGSFYPLNPGHKLLWSLTIENTSGSAINLITR